MVGTFRGRLFDGNQELTGSVEARLPQGDTIFGRGKLGEAITVPVGVWDITFIPDDQATKRGLDLHLVFAKIRISKEVESSIVHNLASQEIRLTPHVYSQNVSWGDNASLYLYLPGKSEPPNAAYFIRSGETTLLQQATYNLEYSYDSGIPLRIIRQITGFNPRPGTHYTIWFDLETPVLNVVVQPSDAADIVSGSVQFQINGHHEKTVMLNSPIHVQQGTYDLVFQWKSQYGVQWTLTRPNVAISGPPGADFVISFDVNDPARQKAS